ncbi:MAG: glycoside hydrolase family 16 protein [Gemmatimonadota bacterium]
MTRRSTGGGGILALGAVLLVLGGCGGDTSTSPTGGDWRLVWQDEFEGPAGQLPDAAKWQFDVGTDWGNAQLEYDTDRPENVSLDGEGHLAITARQEPYLGQDYTSGRIKTQDLFEKTGGRFEARIRLPRGQGIWPAFWLLGADIDEVGWPTCGEIDVMEYRGQEPSVVHGSVHGPGYSAGNAVTRRFYLTDSTFDADFHVFTVEWRGDSIDWYVDGERFQTVTSSDVSGEWAFDHPFFILLNVAVGGGFVGSPDATTAFPQTMLVDWVRVYEGTP